MILGELFIDWTKYIFIAKNNKLSIKLFNKYNENLTEMYLLGYYRKNDDEKS